MTVRFPGSGGSVDKDAPDPAGHWVCKHKVTFPSVAGPAHEGKGLRQEPP